MPRPSGRFCPAYRKLALVIGILGDKDFSGIVREIVPLADRVVVTRPQYARALDVQTLAAEVRKLHGAVSAAETVGEAIHQAREEASPEDLILVTGSLYVVGDARALLVARAGQDGELTQALRDEVSEMRTIPHPTLRRGGRVRSMQFADFTLTRAKRTLPSRYALINAGRRPITAGCRRIVDCGVKS